METHQNEYDNHNVYISTESWAYEFLIWVMTDFVFRRVITRFFPEQSGCGDNLWRLHWFDGRGESRSWDLNIFKFVDNF